MATPQLTLNNLIPGVSAFSLALNVAGIINNKKNVALYILDETTGAKQNILESSLGRVGDITNFFGQSPAVASCEIIENSKLCEHPLEDGKVRADNKVQLPAEIQVRIVLPATEYQDTLEKIKQYKNDNQAIYVETKFGSYKNMQIVSIPCDLNVENVSRITFSLKLKEVLNAENVSVFSVQTVANAADSDTKSTGLKTGISQTVSIGQNVSIA